MADKLQGVVCSAQDVWEVSVAAEKCSRLHMELREERGEVAILLIVKVPWRG